MTRILLVRHGQSEANASGVLQGQHDFALSEHGREQARVTARRLATEEMAGIISSPLSRARETAEIIAAELGLPVDFDDALMEYDFGEASGLTRAQLLARFPANMAAARRGDRLPYPGEEGRPNFYRRVTASMERIRQRSGPLLVVAHGGVIGVICHNVMGIEYGVRGQFSVANCSITELRPGRNGALVLHRTNDDCHLGPLSTDIDPG